MDMPALAVQALAVTIQHLKQFGLEGILSLGASFRPFSSNMEMNLSANTLQQLEVFCDSDMYCSDPPGPERESVREIDVSNESNELLKPLLYF